jgi:adenylate cyclase
VEGNDLFGDGVNISARLEAMADPGGVFVSGTVVSHVRGKVRCTFEDLGEQRLKNMADPIRVYRVDATTTGVPMSSQKSAEPSRPSIAVLPFVNMSGDPEQEYFSDGITEDVITDLSKVSSLRVISRNTAFTFKGRSIETGEIAHRLKANYVVEGSVRKAGGRVRITAQLINGATDGHIWAERYDRDMSDIFALQDEISQAIVKALKIRLLPEERDAIEARSTKDPEAYRLYLLSRHYLIQHGARDLEIGLRFGKRALEIDPDYARAWAVVALCQMFLYMRGTSKETGLAAAERALSLDQSLGEAHSARGRALCELGRYDEARRAHEEAVRLDPESSFVQCDAGWSCSQMGRYEEAAQHLERAAELDETDYAALSQASSCYTQLGRDAEALSAVRRALQRVEMEVARRPDNPRPIVFGVGILALLGEKERAKEWASRALIIDPDDPIGLYNIACGMALMNETDAALDLLEASAPKSFPEQVTWLKKDTDLASLHGHPRFEALVARGEARLAAVQVSEAAPES